MSDAAALVRGGPRDHWSRFLGAPARFRYEASLDGELPDSAWGVLLEEIRAAMRKPGQVSHLPGALEWRQDKREDTGAVEIVVTSRAGTTHVRLNADNRSTAPLMLVGGAWLGFVGATLIAVTMAPGISEWMAGAGGAGGGIAAAWAGWRYTARRWEKHMSQLVARITRTAVDAVRTDSDPAR